MTTLLKPYREFAYLPHQEEGVRWMIERERADATFCRGGILADDMGLGKTWQTIGLFKNVLVRKTLLVTPPVLTRQWTEALEKSKIPFAELNRHRWLGAENAVVFLATYDRLCHQKDFVAEQIWDRIVLDEGQYIRNGPKTRRFRALGLLVSPRKWILSGTPVQNSQQDFANLAAWLGCDVETSLKTLAQNIILRRSITLLADKMPAPPQHERQDLPFKSRGEKTLFATLVGRLEHAMENNFPSACILELYLRIQMFISHPQIYVEAMRRKYGGMYMREDWTHGSTKMAAFSALIATQAPTLVFSHFKLEMDYLAAEAKHSGYEVFFVRGGFSESARNFQIDESKRLAAEGKPVMLVCQITAANCGLNLQHLTRVVFYTQHWNPAVIDQALTRSYRYGQTSEVEVHHLLLGSAEMLNIDRLMLSKHQKKRAAAKDLLPSLEFAYHPDFAVDDEEEDEAPAVAVSAADEDPV
jgi:SNF2 family DNA or RNA helicase